MGNPPVHRARKRFGQHFLHDQNIIRKMIDAINPQVGDRLVEIGPGQGALTLPLLQRCKHLTAIELDHDLIPLLQLQADAMGDLNLINMDILKMDLTSLSLPSPLRIVGNLPYNISTPLMFHLLKYRKLIKDMHFMVQKEVAERIAAQPDNKNYGRLSVMLQYHCRCDALFDVPPGCFSPPPKVDSAVIRLTPHAENPFEDVDTSILQQVLLSAFGQRRKTIANSLRKLIDKSTLLSLDLNPKLRAENLSVADFVAISNTSSKT